MSLCSEILQRLEKGCCNEPAATFHFKCKIIFAHGTPRNPETSAHKSQVKHGTTVLELSIPFHKVVELVVAEDNTSEKIRTLN